MRPREVLGIDPGDPTGVAIVEVGAQAPFVVQQYAEVPAKGLHDWLANALCFNAGSGEQFPHVIAIEDWRYYSTKRGRKGTSQAAFATGRVVGAVEATGRDYVLVDRPDVLRGLNLPANASKKFCESAVRVWVGWQKGPKVSSHIIDAIAAAIAGANRNGLVLS